MRERILALTLIPTLGLVACGVKQKLEDRIQEEVAEKVVEIAAGGEVDIEKQGDKVSIQGKDGQVIQVDGQQGTVHVVDEQGKTHNYEQAADGGGKYQNSDGMVATTGTELPPDFPLTLPPVKQMQVVNRVVQPDGSKAFTVSYEAAGELEAVAAQFRAAFEAKGLTVERTEFKGPDSAMITLAGKQDGGKLEGSAMLSTSSASPNVMVVLGWSDKTGVTP